MTFLVLDSSMRRNDLEAKLNRMGFSLKKNKYYHFTGVCLSIVNDSNNLLLKVHNSPYDIEEMLDYFYLRNLIIKKFRKIKEINPLFKMNEHQEVCKGKCKDNSNCLNWAKHGGQCWFHHKQRTREV